MQYVANTEADKLEMLKTIGVKSFEDLLSGIPADLRVPSSGLKLPGGMSEMELLGDLKKRGQKNQHADRNACFLGAGVYDHYIPAIVGHLATRGEFITAYTPYQGEASQGTLQAIYEYQTMICLLTAMDVSNASMYDGATSVAEAVLLALRGSERKKVVLSELLHPETIQTVRTYLTDIPCEIVLAPHQGGKTGLDSLKKLTDSNTACVVYQNPNFLGYVEDTADLSGIAREAGALVIACVNPLSLSILTPPGETGADVAVGDGQPLGNPPAFGGPHFGFFAVKEAHMRKLPGRISGMTQDKEGKRAFVLTLQAREQHIRREKATSNICTNHMLCALKGLIFLSTLGPNGFRRMGELNVQQSHKAFDKLTKLPGVKPLAGAAFFNEFTLTIDKDPKALAKAFEADRLIGPLHLGRFRKDWQNAHLVAVTEQRTDEEIDRLCDAIRKA
jgi:glycine dehydrogenase subunit 1